MAAFKQLALANMGDVELLQSLLQLVKMWIIAVILENSCAAPTK